MTRMLSGIPMIRRMYSFAFVALTLLLLGFGGGCGGGTSGTGGVTVEGKVLALDNSPLSFLTVTDLLTGNSDVTDQEGDFSLLTEQTDSVTLLFEGEGLNAQATLSEIPPDARRVTARFKADPARNRVEPENVNAESGSSSSRSSSAGSSSSAGTSSAGSSTSSASTSSSSGQSSNDGNSSSSSSSISSSHSSQSSSEASTSGSSSSGTGERVEERGRLSLISPAAVIVNGTTFIPTAATEYRDDEGDDTTLEAFQVGDNVEARGQGRGIAIELERLRKR